VNKNQTKPFYAIHLPSSNKTKPRTNYKPKTQPHHQPHPLWRPDPEAPTTPTNLQLAICHEYDIGTTL